LELAVSRGETTIPYKGAGYFADKGVPMMVWAFVVRLQRQSSVVTNERNERGVNWSALLGSFI
jgi:2'-5' RNA ligase